jgi:D-glycero-D-manno-heptose 1,7-bisphosphate phosphatase
MTSCSPRPAVFFDRDGTLNEDTHYPHKIEDMFLIPGAAKTVRRFCELGYLTVIITNQSGIARGLFNIDALKRFNEALCLDLAKEGGSIDLILHCPHHPDFTGLCSCRKPRPDMIYTAAKCLPIDLSKSLLIGDRTLDIECANAAGIDGHLFLGENLYIFCKINGLF